MPKPPTTKVPPGLDKKNPPTLSSLSVSGPSSVQESNGAQYICTATYSDKSTIDITNDSSWSISPAAAGIIMKKAGEIVEDFETNGVRWTRPPTKGGTPHPKRRNIHLGDWLMYLARNGYLLEQGLVGAGGHPVRSAQCDDPGPEQISQISAEIRLGRERRANAG